jgi:hypothetical protein
MLSLGIIYRGAGDRDRTGDLFLGKESARPFESIRG